MIYISLKYKSLNDRRRRCVDLSRGAKAEVKEVKDDEIYERRSNLEMKQIESNSGTFARGWHFWLSSLEL